jgi:Restriction endonuclease S subunits
MILGDVCNVVMGQAPSGDSYNEDGNGMLLIAGASDLGELYPRPSRSTTSPGKISRPGDIILCIRATIGDKNWSDKEYCLGRGVAALRPKDAEQLAPQFLWHWVGANSSALKSKGRGATFLQITRADIEELPIVIPKIAEQRRIAAILDKADDIRRKRQEALKLVDDLVKSQFIEMFGDPVTNPKGWKIGNIGLVGHVGGGYAFKSSEFVEEGVPIIRIGNIMNFRINLDDSVMCHRELLAKYQDYVCNKNDILMAMSGATVGKPGIFMQDETALINQRVARIRVDDKICSPSFMFELIKSNYFQNQVQQLSAGCAQPNISGKQIENIPCPVPPVPLQNEFAAFVEQADKSKFTMQRQLDEIETLSSALKQEFFA